VTDPAHLPIRRNTILLAGAMAALSGMFQLVAALASITFVEVTGIEGLLGLGPAIFLLTAAVTAFQAGRAMDRFGRVPVLATGFAVGAAGAIVTGFGARTETASVVVLGFVMLGAALGTVTLVRTAGGDMYPPERRARGIALVLSGAVVGAVLGPAVFSPLFADRGLSAPELATPWFAASGFAIAGMTLVLFVRPDPRRIAELIAPAPAGEPAGQPPGPRPPAAPLAEILRRPGVAAALVGALASFAVMVSVMNLTGYVVVDHHGHEQQDVFPIIGAHVLGMYALVLAVGPLIDRIGRRPPLLGGLAVMAMSCAGMVLVEGVAATAILLFGLGLGWNLSFVAASAEMADRTSPHERGKLLGFADQLSGFLGAALAILGGLALDALGVAALGLGAAAIALVPAAALARRRPPRRAPAAPGETAVP
jgi:MFS family permease